MGINHSGKSFFTPQHDAMDCGSACLRMVTAWHGKKFSPEYLRSLTFTGREGVSLLSISDAAEKIGFRTLGVRISLEQLVNEAVLPCIAHWQQNHFVVVHKVAKHKNPGKTKIHVADPGGGLVTYTAEEFKKGWLSHARQGEEMGICLLLEPTPEFHNSEPEKTSRANFRFLFAYLTPHRKLIVQLFVAFLAGSLIQLIFPFITQSVVDVGINTRNLNFIYLALAAQLALMAGRTVVEFIRGWILLHISARINVSLISDFLIKLMKLPMGFFDSKMIGDMMQRINDHQRIERFLTNSSLNVLFSMVNLLVFAGVLLFYSPKIFFVFVAGSILYALWVILFLRKRRELDHKRFALMSGEQSNLIQLITGMQEIKLNNCEKQKRWEWERIQARLFKVSVKGLALSQYQQAGAVFINETKNILITFFAAYLAYSGQITLGAMLAVQYIIGQLNSPIEQLIGFIQTAQDAKISLERLSEVHNREDEEENSEQKLTQLPADGSIFIQNLMFQYEGPRSPQVLKNITLQIPENKVTAIVGASGSGKTTLLKLMLGFYPPVEGAIKIGNVTDLKYFNHHLWREYCGVVMQDGFIFSDTIARNIAVNEEIPDTQKLLMAVETANMKEFIESLPLGYNTKIGQEGHGLSQGQKQRLLIARAIYKSPRYLFLDEATNSLDAQNERQIMEKLYRFYEGRTVVIVAHRLSTVKNADKIIVLDKGEIAETGSHTELTEKKGLYFELVRNQLELGS